MSLWRYTAVDLRGTRRARRSGEHAGDTAVEVRAALRRIGLQVIDLRPLRKARAVRGAGGAWKLPRLLGGYARGYLRKRRRQERAELYDSLGTMLASGVPMLEAVETVIGSTRRRRSALRLMLLQVRDDLRSGLSLGDAVARHPSWFEPGEVAMVKASQVSGTLPEVLRSLSARHERSGELTHRLIGALAYPALVSLVGLGVVVFLSVKTLPNLVAILENSRIETPALTASVMGFGRLLAGQWWAILLALVLVMVIAAVAADLAGRAGIHPPSWLRRLSPKVLRRLAVARVSLQLAELLRTGVPMVDALRVLAPTTSGLVGGLRRRLVEAADSVEQGHELSGALSDEHWFDPEFRRLLDIGQASGELEVLLERIGQRYARQSNRLIDRLTALLEPCVLLILATLVGTVVMAAVLPLLRLQEIL